MRVLCMHGSFYAWTDNSSFVIHLLFRPCQSHKLLMSEKYKKKMTWTVVSGMRAWTQSELGKKQPLHRPRWRDIVESCCCGRLLHSNTVILGGQRWTKGNSSWYYCLVCYFRHDLTGEWQGKGPRVPSKEKCSMQPFRVLLSNFQLPLYVVCTRRSGFTAMCTIKEKGWREPRSSKLSSLHATKMTRIRPHTQFYSNVGLVIW